MFDRLPDAWADLVQNVVLPLRHYEAAAQMVSAHATRFGWGTSVTQCFTYAAFDRIGNAQILPRRHLLRRRDRRAAVARQDGVAGGRDLAAAAQTRRFTLVEMDWGRDGRARRHRPGHL